MTEYIIGIDPGRVSGVCMLKDGKYFRSMAEEFTRSRRDEVFSVAADMQVHEDATITIVMETWSLHGKWSNVAKQTVCEEAGRWIDSADEYAFKHRVMRVMVDKWRKAVLGKQPRLKSPAWKALAQRRAAFAMLQAGFQPKEMLDDEAEAVCIAGYACTDEGKDAIRALNAR